MDFKNERLMMSKEEVRNRVKELLNENQVDLITKYMFLEQQCKKQQEIIDKAIEYVEGHKYTMKHYEPYGTPTGLPNYETHDIKGYYELLDILKNKEV